MNLRSGRAWFNFRFKISSARDPKVFFRSLAREDRGPVQLVFVASFRRQRRPILHSARDATPVALSVYKEVTATADLDRATRVQLFRRLNIAPYATARNDRSRAWIQAGPHTLPSGSTCTTPPIQHGDSGCSGAVLARADRLKA